MEKVLENNRVSVSSVISTATTHVFNLIPLPPLDGSRILAAFLPDRMVYQYYRYQNIIMLAVFVLLFTGVLSRPLGWLTTQVYNGIMNLAALPFSFA